MLALAEHPDPDEVRRVEKLVGVEVERMSRLVEDMLLLAQADEEEFLRPSVIELRPFVQRPRPTGSRTSRRGASWSARSRRCSSRPTRTAWRRRCATCCATRSRTPPRTAPSQLGVEAGRRPRAASSSTTTARASRPTSATAVFDRFRRLDGGRARDAGGAGLGLAIVQAIVHAHGGRAWADAAPSGGARLVLEIPAFTPSARRRDERAVAGRADRRDSGPTSGYDSPR